MEILRAPTVCCNALTIWEDGRFVRCNQRRRNARASDATSKASPATAIHNGELRCAIPGSNRIKSTPIANSDTAKSNNPSQAF